MKPCMLLVGALILATAASIATAQIHTARVGLLSPGVGLSPRHEAFREALQTHGWIEGQNLTIEYRFGGDDYDRLRALADDLVKLKVDVIYAPTAPSAQAAKSATREIPIVFHTLNDPVRGGLVTSFSRPGGNLTGNAGVGPELDRKRIELLKEIAPSLSIVTILVNPRNVMTAPRLQVIEEATRALKLRVQVLRAWDVDGLERAFEAMARSKPAGLIVFEDPIFSLNRRPIIDFAARHRVVTVYTQSGWAEEGGLIEYAPNQTQLIRHAAAYVDRILRGARPADLPVEQATKFDVVINLRTAKALGVTFPPAVLLRAERVIE